MVAMSILTSLIGIIILFSANGAIHEIQSFMMFIISAILYSSHKVIIAINKVNKTLKSKEDLKNISIKDDSEEKSA